MKNRLAILTAAAIVAATVQQASAQGTGVPSGVQPLVTNFTLLNIGSSQANGLALYYKDNGIWGSETFTIPVGGQAIFRQQGSGLGNPGLLSGRGSAVVISDRPLAGVVQIRAVGGEEASQPGSAGAYQARGVGARRFYVPLLAKGISTASGVANAQIVVQNASPLATRAVITLYNLDATVQRVTTTEVITPGASVYYDLWSDANLPGSWYGSAEVSGVNGDVVVISNFFTGVALQTFNAFPAEAAQTQWYIPLFAYRLANGLSTPVAAQNVSNQVIPTGTLRLECKTAAGSPGSDFTAVNGRAIGPRASVFFNPVNNEGLGGSGVVDGFYGPCVLRAPREVVVFVQMRFVVGPIAQQEAAAYEAFPLGTTQKRAVVPLVAKRLPNGFATAVSVQNLDLVSSATFTVTYLPSDGSSPIVLTYTVPPGGSLIHNHRLAGGVNSVPVLPDGWLGGMLIDSDRPLAAFAQLTFLRSLNPNLRTGDNFMAHTALLR